MRNAGVLKEPKGTFVQMFFAKAPGGHTCHQAVINRAKPVPFRA